ncbi:MAG: radical SAM protein [Thermoanaerobaculia bacterium]|nr:radical SAM protein [Thermoanaerobaculia bacterium]
MEVPNRARIVMWELTRACKLSCLHCPSGAQHRRSPLELSTYEAYKTIDQVVALGPEELIITGGDPLERPDIYELINYASRRGIQPTLTVSATQTLTGATISKLRINGLTRLAVSIDSATPSQHDAERGISGQFATTLLATRWARTAGITTEVNTLVTRRNMGELETLSSLLSELGIQRWNVYFTVPIGASSSINAPNADEVESVLEQLASIDNRVPFAIRTFEAPQYRRVLLQKALEAKQRSIDEFFGAESANAALLEIANARATTDRNEMIFISHTGEVSISAFLPMTAGNVRYQPLTSIHRGAELFASLRNEHSLKGKCGHCEFRRTCGGSRARAFAVTGDLFASDPLCSYQPGAYIAAAPTVARRGDERAARPEASHV